MIALLLLTIVTFLIVFVQVRIWKFHKNIVFPMVTAVMFFWSLLGAWLFIIDRLSGIGSKIGFAYYYLLEKMFQVQLDTSYNLAILSYGACILIFQCFTYLGLRFMKNKFQKGLEFSTGVTQTVSSLPFVLIAFTCLVGSFFFVKDVVISSLLLNESVYSNVRSGFVPHYNIHQYFNWVMVLTIAIYLGIYFRSKLMNTTVKKPGGLFWMFFVLMIVYLSVIGSRHELFFGGIFMLLFLSYPHRSIRQHKRFYGWFFVLFFLILAVNDPMRGLTSVIFQKAGLTNLLNSPENRKIAEVYSEDRTYFMHTNFQQSYQLIQESKKNDTVLLIDHDTIVLKLYDFAKQLRMHPGKLFYKGEMHEIKSKYVSDTYQKLNFFQKLIKSGTNIIFSNELFAGHFSLYGIYQYDVKPSYGIALRNLVGSANQNTYQYYANELNLPKDQGFTINHISSWYLNFGIVGFVLGAAFIAFCYLLPMYLLHLFLQKKKQTVMVLVIFMAMAAYMPLIIRSDLLVFEGLLKQVIIVPVVILIAVRIFHWLFPINPKNHVE